MQALAGYILEEKLHEGSHSLVYRGYREEAPEQRLIIKFLHKEYPSPKDIASFKQECALTQALKELDCVSSALSIHRHQNTYLMLFEDREALSLDRLIQTEPLALDTFLSIARRMAAGLEAIHQHHIIHKDVNPSNVVWVPSTREILWIDFGISTRLSREQPSIQNPQMLEGTLAYMSPEQTGRMNRSLDYRTDLYSLGATFYQLLTGHVPFVAYDAVEWVHAHLAKSPRPLAQVRPSIPVILDKIIQKLMAKRAEERYQSAAGLLHDLEKCTRQLREKKYMDVFPLAQQDRTHFFQIPQILYGRKEQREQLLHTFDNVVEGASAAVFISGFSGIGKTSLVHEIHRPITTQRGFFLSGKCDPFKRNVPYFALIQAFRGFVVQLLSEPQEVIQEWKKNVLDAVGKSGQIIIDVLPEMEHIIGPQPKVPDLSPTESQHRFQLVFKGFVQVFASASHPLCIFIDDLQWSSSASLELIQSLLHDGETHHILLIGAYRDNEVQIGHPLLQLFDELQGSHAIVDTIMLSPLEERHVSAMLESTLLRSEEDVAELVSICLDKTRGNPFFLRQMLRNLYEEGLIFYNPELSHWSWDIEALHQVELTDNVVELMLRTLAKLPEQTQEVLRCAAAIGSRFDIEQLAIIYAHSPVKTLEHLWEALESGLIISTGKQNPSTHTLMEDDSTAKECVFRFVHDRMLQAAYESIPEAHRAELHAGIGRSLFQYYNTEEREDHIFELANHFSRGLECIIEEDERCLYIQLHHQAGLRARGAAAFAPAFQFLQRGLDAFVERDWERNYEQALSLHVNALEMAACCGDFTSIESHSKAALQHVRSRLDRALVIRTLIYVRHSQGESKKALELGIEALAALGIRLPHKPSIAHIVWQLLRTHRSLRGRSPQQLLRLPLMTEPHMLSAMSILVKITSVAYIHAPQLMPLIIAKQVELSASYGNCPESVFGYAAYGLVLSSVFHAYDRSFAFGELALCLVEEHNFLEFKTKALVMKASFSDAWKTPFQATIPNLLKAYHSGLESGDVEFTCSAIQGYCTHLFFAGGVLSDVYAECEKAAEIVIQLGNQKARDFIWFVWQCSANLLGQSEEPTLLSGAVCDAEVIIVRHKEQHNQTGLFFFHYFKSLLFFLMQKPQKALLHTEEAGTYLEGVMGSVLTTHWLFLDTLIRIDVFRAASKTSSLRRHLRKTIRKFKKWAKHAPMNQTHRLCLLEAELAYINGEYERAAKTYDEAIACACEHEFLFGEALCHERAALFYLEQRQEKIASMYLMDARYAFDKWGAVVKCQKLDEQYSLLLATSIVAQRSILQEITLSSMSQGSTTGSGTGTTGTGTTGAGGLLDLATVMKATLAITSDLQLAPLLERLLHIMMENAGASRGVLLLQESERLFVEASGCIEDDMMEVLQHIPLHASERCSRRIVHYTKRTKEALVLKSAVSEGAFTQDHYIQHNQVKSLLCAPIFYQGQLTGILYLENNLTEGAFSPERIEVLQMLSAQAAISIENARLYANLEEKVAERTQNLRDAIYNLEQAQEQLVQSEKMASLGTLVSGVAHEINNPANFTYGGAQNLQRRLQELRDMLFDMVGERNEETKEVYRMFEEAFVPLFQNLDAILDGTDRIKEIVSDLRTFSRLDEAERKCVSIVDGLTSTISLVRANYKNSVEFITDFQMSKELECWPAQLNQVFMNIMVNAAQAILEKKEQTGCDEMGKIYIRTFGLENQMVIQFEDTGTGMTEEVRKRLFEPFYTTKSVGDGMGLGMAITYGIIEKHDGQIEIETKLGVGSTFTISLPFYASMDSLDAAS